jgi:hypothetical protein
MLFIHRPAAVAPLDPSLSELFDQLRAASRCAGVCGNRDSAPPREVIEHALTVASSLTTQLQAAMSQRL